MITTVLSANVVDTLYVANLACRIEMFNMRQLQYNAKGL
jgi:hypothetical protein